MQGMVQCIVALSGFLLVRVLDKREFAAYTIATSLQTVLNVLTDSGIGTGLNAVGGRVWRDRGALSRLVSTALEIRFKLALFAVPVGVGFSLLLFRQNEVPWLKALSLTLVIVLTLWGLFNTSVYTAPLRLHGQYLAVQKLELITALVRLTLLGALALTFINALAAVMVATVGATLQAILVRKKAAEVLDFGAPRDLAQRRDLVGLIRKQFFSTLFFAFQGQITIWLISLFGNVERVAEVGALGRLAVVFTLIGTVMSAIIVPTFARCDKLPRLLRLFWMTFAGYSVFAVVIMIASAEFPRQILWILGAKYTSLQPDLPWLVANSVLAGLSWVPYCLVSARGWIWHAWMLPLLIVLFQAALIPFLDLSTVKGVLIFGLGSAFATLLVQGYMAVRGLWKSWKAGAVAPVAV